MFVSNWDTSENTFDVKFLVFSEVLLKILIFLKKNTHKEDGKENF